MEDNEGEDDLSDMDEGFDEEEEKTPPEDEQTTGGETRIYNSKHKQIYNYS